VLNAVSITRRCGPKVRSYGDDTQLYFHADPTEVDSKVHKVVARIEEISQWMGTNRLILNRGKAHFMRPAIASTIQAS